MGHISPLIMCRKHLNEMTSSLVAASAVLRAATATPVHNLCRRFQVASRVVHVPLHAVLSNMMLNDSSAERSLRRSANWCWRMQFTRAVVAIYA
jgi:hypothetical protein